MLVLYGVSIDSLLTTNGVFLSEGDGRFSPWSLTADGIPSADSLGSVLCAHQYHATTSTSSILTETVRWTCYCSMTYRT